MSDPADAPRPPLPVPPDDTADRAALMAVARGDRGGVGSERRHRRGTHHFARHVHHEHPVVHHVAHLHDPQHEHHHHGQHERQFHRCLPDVPAEPTATAQPDRPITWSMTKSNNRLI